MACIFEPLASEVTPGECGCDESVGYICGTHAKEKLSQQLLPCPFCGWSSFIAKKLDTPAPTEPQGAEAPLDFEPLKRECDRKWENEPPQHIVNIAANALYWRQREISTLREQLEQAKRDLETGFMDGAYARLKHLQTIETKFYELSAAPRPQEPRIMSGLLKEFVAGYAEANNKKVPARPKYDPYVEGADDFSAFLEQKLPEFFSPAQSPRTDFNTLNTAINDLAELAEMMREKPDPTGFDHSIALRLDQIGQTLKSCEPAQSPQGGDAEENITDNPRSWVAWKKRAEFLEVFSARRFDDAKKFYDKIIAIRKRLAAYVGAQGSIAGADVTNAMWNALENEIEEDVDISAEGPAQSQGAAPDQVTLHAIDVEVGKIAKSDGWPLPDAGLIEFGRKIWLAASHKPVHLRDLVGLCPLPEGVTSVDYVRKLRDAPYSNPSCHKCGAVMVASIAGSNPNHFYCMSCGATTSCTEGDKK